MAIGIPETVETPDMQQPFMEQFIERLKGHLEGWRLYHFHDTSSTSPMKKTVDLHDNRHLRPDGSNLAALLILTE